MIAKVITILSLFGVVSLSQSTYWEGCGNNIQAPYHFSVTGCDPNVDRCIFYLGSSVEAWWTFTIQHATRTVTPKAEFRLPTGLFTGFLPYPGSLPNGCLNAWGKVQCPMKEAYVGSYKAINVSVPYIPLAKDTFVDIRFSLLDELRRTIVCVLAKVVLQQHPLQLAPVQRTN